MRLKSIFPMLMLTFLLAGLPGMTASAADIGPKPSMSFSFAQEVPGEKLTITGGEMYECSQSDCGDAKPLAKLGPQAFRCEATSCSALAYGFSDYHRIEVQFSDGKTRASNVFATDGFSGNYKVTIRAADLQVEPNTLFGLPSAMQWVLICGCCCLLVILFIVGIILLVRRLHKK
jgi:hypothetical protein